MAYYDNVARLQRKVHINQKAVNFVHLAGTIGRLFLETGQFPMNEYVREQKRAVNIAYRRAGGPTTKDGRRNALYHAAEQLDAWVEAHDAMVYAIAAGASDRLKVYKAGLAKLQELHGDEAKDYLAYQALDAKTRHSGLYSNMKLFPYFVDESVKRMYGEQNIQKLVGYRF